MARQWNTFPEHRTISLISPSISLAGEQGLIGPAPRLQTKQQFDLFVMSSSDEPWLDIDVESPGNWIFAWADEFGISRGAIISVLQSGLTR